MKRKQLKKVRVGPRGKAILAELSPAPASQFDPYRSGRGSDSTARAEDPPGLTTEQLADAIYGDALQGDDWQEASTRARSRISAAGQRLATAGLVTVSNRTAHDFSWSGDRRRLERWLFITDAGRDVAEVPEA